MACSIRFLIKYKNTIIISKVGIIFIKAMINNWLLWKLSLIKITSVYSFSMICLACSVTRDCTSFIGVYLSFSAVLGECLHYAASL